MGEMREILFRGKRVDNGEWVYGVPIKKALVGSHDGYYPKIIPECDGRHQTVYSTAIEEETVGQYTGLRDKNGTRIFEGDVLSGHLDDLFPKDESRYEVVWYDYGWHIKSSDGIFDTMEQNWINMFLEVIGNIHDNKNLLKNQEVGE